MDTKSRITPEADALMQAEPLIQRGLRRFDLWPCELREGRMTITLNVSTGGFRLDGPRSEPGLVDRCGCRLERHEY